MFRSNSQPLCRYCGGKIGKWTRVVYLRGHFCFRLRHDDIFSRSLDATADDIRHCRILTNQKVVAVKRGTYAGQSCVVCFSEWDGESYRDEFFCNGDHARRFGYAAARAGYTMDKWRNAARQQVA